MDPVTAAELLAGPRGRRLCLELAVDADPELRAGVFAAAGAMMRGHPGAMRLRSGPAGANEAEPDPPAPDELAARIAAVPDAVLASATASEPLHRALATSVDAAVYWQPLREEDVLAALPGLRAVLARVAAAVVASATFAAWAAPAAPEQWRVVFDDPAHPLAPAAADPAVELARWRAGIAAEEMRARAERPVDPEARWSGSWWSTPPHRLVGTTGGHPPHGLALVEDAAGLASAVVEPVGGAGRVLELDAATWVALCRAHPIEVTASRRHDWYRATGRADRWAIPDWAAVAEEWDAVHLPIAQYLALAGRPLDLGGGVASLVAGWDPDRTVRLAGRLRARGLPERWERVDADEAWHRVDRP